MDLCDRTEDSIIDFTFSTRNVSAAPATLAGTPVISVYKANGITQSTAGITLTVDFDAVTGLNQVRIDTSADVFYATANDYSVVITTGTVNSVSVVGTTIATFSIENRFMRGTDSSLLAASAPTNFSDLAVTVTTGLVSVGTNNDKAGYALSTAGILAIWDQLTSALTTASTIGKLIVDMAGSTFSTATDSLEAIRNRGDAAWITGSAGSTPNLLQNTTIATLATQVSFTLTAGSADNDAYNNMVAIITDSSTSTQKAVARISDYAGSTKTITLEADPAIFTMAAGDTIDITAQDSIQPVTVENINTQVGAAGAGLTAINLPDQTMNITGNLSGTVGSISNPSNIFTTQMTESYAADGVAPTLAQGVFIVMAHLGEFSNTGVTQTLKQIDGSTTAATYIYDSSSSPTSKTRAT